MRAVLCVVVLSSSFSLAAPPAVHATEPRDEGRGELVLYPLGVQVNGSVTQHVGTSATVLWHAQERFALALSGGYNWYAAESALSAEVSRKLQVDAAPGAPRLLTTWALFGGAEVTALDGDLAFLERAKGRLGLTLTAGLGATGSRVALAPTLDVDAGVRLTAQVGVGLRLALGDRFTLRFDVRDAVSSSAITRLDGCTASDVVSVLGTPPGSTAGVSAGCQPGWVASASGPSRQVPGALSLLRSTSAGLVHNVQVLLGGSFLF